ncbi:MAG: hypothetical protein LBB36_07200 [Fibromonadaceae bacterium]|jgi:hypothetical protein|nr:hypothetical protein [Fibromonadaceae bacterium]
MKDKKELVKALCDDFEHADKIIQDVKSITKDEIIPAISQLRYAGWHLARWLNSDITGNSDENEFSEAIGHSKRAIFEASRYGILFCMLGIQSFRDMYSGEIMPGIIANYSEKMYKAEESRKFVISVSERERDVRADACYAHFVTIRDILQELICCQPELNRLKEQKQNEVKILRRRHKQLIIVSIASLIVTAIATAIALF